jgi:tetratricopeptide (TPR) repeat protein
MSSPASSDPLHGLRPAGLLATARGPLQGEWLPPTPEELAGTIPGCDVHELIGRGGMGAVYRAFQPDLARQVALKILSPDADEDGTLTPLFQQEIQLLATLQHPNIVTIYQAGTTTTGWLYLMMEWVPGEDLAQTLRRAPLPPARVLALLQQACQGLAYAHQRGIIHRDIKPSNLLVTPDDRLKLTDFGLATFSQSEVPAARPTAGTPDYTAPEAWQGNPDPRADVYSLGVTAWQLLTGTLPSGAFLPPSQRCPGLPEVYDDIILRALAAEPSRRYPNAAAFLHALERPGHQALTLRRRTWLAAGFGILTLLAGTAGFLAWQKSREAQRQRQAALTQRTEATKLIDFLINELMWRFRSQGDLARFDELFQQLDAYFTRFDTPDADADFCYHLATYIQVKAIHADRLGRTADAERLYRQLLTARDRHATAAPGHDTALANRAEARLFLARFLHQQNRPAEALPLLTELLTQSQTLPPLPNAQGQRLVRCRALRFQAELAAAATPPDSARAATSLTEADRLIQQLLVFSPDYAAFLAEQKAIRQQQDSPVPPVP